MLAGCASPPDSATTANARATLQAFGLVGSFGSPYAASCARSFDYSREIFNVSVAGEPTELDEIHTPELRSGSRVVAQARVIRMTYRILTAEPAGDRAIRITKELVDMDVPHEMTTTGKMGTRSEQVWAKNGDIFRIEQEQFVGGAIVVKDGHVVGQAPNVVSSVWRRCS